MPANPRELFRLGHKADIMTRDSLHKTLRRRIEVAAMLVF